jgi:polyphosphate kinase
VHPAEAEWLERHFREQILPVLTPQAIDPSHPFPFITNLGLSLIFALETEGTEAPVTELLMIPATLKRFVKLPGDGARFIAIDNVILAHFGMLFPGFRKVAAGAFRLLRDSDIEIEEDAEDLVRYFRSAIKRRRAGESSGSSSPPTRRSSLRTGPGRACRERRRWSAKAAASSALSTLRNWSRSIALI